MELLKYLDELYVEDERAEGRNARAGTLFAVGQQVGDVKRNLAPSFISCTPSVQPGMTWFSPKSAGSPRLYELSKTVPSSRRPS